MKSTKMISLTKALNETKGMRIPKSLVERIYNLFWRMFEQNFEYEHEIDHLIISPKEGANLSNVFSTKIYSPYAKKEFKLILQISYFVDDYEIQEIGALMDNIDGVMYIEMQFPAAFDGNIKELKRNLMSKVYHEIVHIFDVESFDSAFDIPEDDYEYFQLKHEIIAYSNQVLHELKHAVKSNPALMQKRPDELLEFSKSWRKVEPFITDKQKQVFYKAAFNLLQGTSN